MIFRGKSDIRLLAYFSFCNNHLHNLHYFLDLSFDLILPWSLAHRKRRAWTLKKNDEAKNERNKLTTPEGLIVERRRWLMNLSRTFARRSEPAKREQIVPMWRKFRPFPVAAPLCSTSQSILRMSSVYGRRRIHRFVVNVRTRACSSRTKSAVSSSVRTCSLALDVVRRTIRREIDRNAGNRLNYMEWKKLGRV